MNSEADDPETVAIHKIIAHIADVYRREGEEGLTRHVAELIALIEEASERRRKTGDCD
jgi:hypothetical protein